jgi:hypothetical protein
MMGKMIQEWKKNLRSKQELWTAKRQAKMRQTYAVGKKMSLK